MAAGVAVACKDQAVSSAEFENIMIVDHGGSDRYTANSVTVRCARRCDADVKTLVPWFPWRLGRGTMYSPFRLQGTLWGILRVLICL